MIYRVTAIYRAVIYRFDCNNMLFLMKSYNRWVNNYSIFWKWLAFVFEHERSKSDIDEVYPYQMTHVRLELELWRLEPLGKIKRLINSPYALIIRCARSILLAILRNWTLTMPLWSQSFWYHGKWFEPRSISSLSSVTVRVSVVLKRTVRWWQWLTFRQPEQ